LKKRLQKA
jgi:hypothetical protein